MAPKSDKDSKSTTPKSTSAKNADVTPSPKSKKQFVEEEDDLDDEIDAEVKPSAKKSASKSITKKLKSSDEDEEEEIDEIEDDWEKPEEDDDWDPDFDEFDIPKSRGKKVVGGKGKAKSAEDADFKLDDDFKEFDLFNDKVDGFDDDEDDDF